MEDDLRSSRFEVCGEHRGELWFLSDDRKECKQQRHLELRNDVTGAS